MGTAADPGKEMRVHIAEGFLPPLHAVGWTMAAAPFVAHGARVMAGRR